MYVVLCAYLFTREVRSKAKKTKCCQGGPVKALFFALCLGIFTPIALSGASSLQSTVTNPPPLEPSEKCKACHADIYQQYMESSHSKAFSNPLFWTQYFREVVPRATIDKSFEPIAKRCIFCHSPGLYMSYPGMIKSPEQAFFVETGVTCDFCHSFDGFTPNGDYQMITTGKKQGPFTDNNFHSQESHFIKTSEFCAACHNSSNHLGAEARTTYDEWGKSRYKELQLPCQECHMNMHGYLKDGKAQFETGMAAKIKADAYRFKTESEVLLTPERTKLYTHLFKSDPVAAGSISLDAALGKARMPDGKVIVNVEVKNRGAGHRMPSGSSDLRILWLDISAVDSDGREFAVKQSRQADNNSVDYSISCSDPDDECILAGTAVPGGRRIYRAVFVDKHGRRASSFIDASKIIFDNRLDAGEVRLEKYYLKVPPDYSGKILLSVAINYLAAPTSFTQRLGIPDYKNVKINSLQKEFTLQGVKKGE